MTAVPLEDIFDELTSETQKLLRGDNHTGASSSSLNATELTSSAAATIQYDPNSDFSIPLQVLQHALKNSLLVSVETVQGYLYQGTLTALDSFCNLTLVDVSVYRRRVPHVDFQQGSAMLEKGTSMGYRTSVMVRAPQIVLVELPNSNELKSAYSHMARSVRRHLQKQRKLSETHGGGKSGDAVPSTTPAAAASLSDHSRTGKGPAGGPERGKSDITRSGAFGVGKQRDGQFQRKPGQGDGRGFARQKSNAKKVLFKQAKK
ncbi:RNA-binding (LSM) protein, putative [Bodo saltans]|uniref:RNA-binding (LSM) protein, putative n=1 Tax=Bodo saltans TaxID=75058 RepID=A0A0S4IS40_BODSA|nr:RNA-binding (LSM) protein, putative [Bodo saltans]|eukprot:CUF55854.1 RNA-binding (LSM) protein, putative [Bodo saltans]